MCERRGDGVLREMKRAYVSPHSMQFLIRQFIDEALQLLSGHGTFLRSHPDQAMLAQIRGQFGPAAAIRTRATADSSVPRLRAAPPQPVAGYHTSSTMASASAAMSVSEALRRNVPGPGADSRGTDGLWHRGRRRGRCSGRWHGIVLGLGRRAAPYNRGTVCRTLSLPWRGRSLPPLERVEADTQALQVGGVGGIVDQVAGFLGVGGQIEELLRPTLACIAVRPPYVSDFIWR